MTRTIYLNGTYHPYHQAKLHVEDRATLFADAVYEVIEVKSGARVDEDAHLKRLQRSLNELQIKPEFSLKTLPFIIRETIQRNRVKEGYVYIQISRGVAPRDFIFPPKTTKASLTVWARRKDRTKAEEKAAIGIKVICLEDIRWQRPDIKTTNLVASVLARQTAREQGAEEAWLFTQQGNITEGAASNAWIITEKSELITHPANKKILKGITRDGVMRLAAALNLTYKEQAFTKQQAKSAKEAFISAATNLVMPVIQIDDVVIGSGKPGPITKKLRHIFHEFAQISD